MSKYCLHLKHVPPEADAKDIRQLFSKFDIPYRGVSLHGGPEGNAFVSFTHPEDLLEATSYNNADFMGRRLEARLIKESDMKASHEKVKQELTSQITEIRTVKRMSMETMVVHHTSMGSLPDLHKAIESLPEHPPWWQKQQLDPASPTELFTHSSSMYGGGEAKKICLSTEQPDEGRYHNSGGEITGNLRSQQPEAGRYNSNRSDAAVDQGLDAQKLQMEIEIEERIAREIQEGLKRKRELVERLKRRDSGPMAASVLDKPTTPQKSEYQGESRLTYSQPASYPSQTDAPKMQPQTHQDFPGRSQEVSTFDTRQEERYQVPRTTKEQPYDRLSQAELSAGQPARQNYGSQDSNIYLGPKPYNEGSGYSAPRTQSEYQTASVGARPSEPLSQTVQGGQDEGYSREYPEQSGSMSQHGDPTKAAPRYNEPDTQAPYEGNNQGRLGGYSGLRTQLEDQTSAAIRYNEPQSQALHEGQYEGYSQKPSRYPAPRPDVSGGFYSVDRFPPNPHKHPDPYEAVQASGGSHGIDRYTTNPRSHLDPQQNRYTANPRRPFDPYHGGQDHGPDGYGADRVTINPRRHLDQHWGRQDGTYCAEQRSKYKNRPGYLQMTNVDRTITTSHIKWFFAGYQISPMGIKIRRDNTSTTVFVKFNKIEDAHTCFQMNKRLLNGKVVNIKLVSASVFQALNQPNNPVSAPVPVQPPYKGNTKPNLYYVALKFLPQTATACSMWERFGGASGPSLGALLLDAKGNRMEKIAFIAFENENDRDAALPLLPDARSWTHKAVYASYINAPRQSRMYKTSPTGDVELNAEEIAVLRQKFLSNSFRKQNLGKVKSDWEMEDERQTLNRISRVLFKLSS